MSLPITPVLREVVTETSIIDLDRALHDEPVEYPGIKDGMLYLHAAWQDLMKAVRAQKDLPEAAVLPAIKLAAAAVKFTQDLGTSEALDPLRKDNTHRQAILLEKVKLHGRRLSSFLGVKAG